MAANNELVDSEYTQKIKARSPIGEYYTNLSKSIEIYSLERTICHDERKTNSGVLVFPVGTDVFNHFSMHSTLTRKNASFVFA